MACRGGGSSGIRAVGNSVGAVRAGLDSRERSAAASCLVPRIFVRRIVHRIVRRRRRMSIYSERAVGAEPQSVNLKPSFLGQVYRPTSVGKLIKPAFGRHRNSLFPPDRKRRPIGSSRDEAALISVPEALFGNFFA